MERQIRQHQREVLYVLLIQQGEEIYHQRLNQY